MTPLAISIGTEEIALILSAAGVTGAALTLAGRWQGARSTRLRVAREEGEKEQKEKDRLERLEEKFKVHLEEANQRSEELEQTSELVRTTAQTVNTLAGQVRDLTTGANQLNATMMKFFTDAMTKGLVLKPVGMADLPEEKRGS